jgi:hypothetical protein
MKRRGRKKRSDNADPALALHKDALDAFRGLKRKHRPFCERNLDAVRKIIRKAQGRVFHRKPGPKADPRVAAAARERGRGAEWPHLYPKYIEDYAKLREFMRSLFETGFQRKVNGYLQRHPVLLRKLRKRGGGVNSGDSGA